MISLPLTNPQLSHEFAHHHPSYRCVVLSSIRGVSEMEVFYGHGPTLSLEHLSKTDSFFKWVNNSFRHFANLLGRPWALINGDFFVHKNWDLAPEQLRYLQKHGLNIFNHEPLFIYNHDGSWPWNPHQGNPCYRELEKLSQFVQQNKIPHVTVHICESDLAEDLNRSGAFAPLTFKQWNSYLALTVENERTSRHPPRPVPLMKKIICLNARYEAIRELLVGFLVGRRHHEHSLITFYHWHNEEEFLWRLPFDPRQLAQWDIIELGIKSMQSRLPLTIEAKNPKALDPSAEAVPGANGVFNLRNPDLLRERFAPSAFLYTYCESRPFSPSSEISEKTLVPIFIKKPFLPFAAPHFLRYLKRLGFRTFGDFWDESYDEIENTAERFSHYLKVVDELASKSWEEIDELQTRIQPILDHNFKWAHEQVLEREKFRLLKDSEFTL